MTISEYKVILLGDTSVGKTSICNRKIRGQFLQVAPTLGVANSKIIVDLGTEQVELNIWDTAGQEQYQSITPIYMKNADVCIIVASLFDEKSIENIKKWDQSVRENTENVSIIIAINKTDIIGTPPISISDISSNLSNKYGEVFFVSAKNGSGIDELFTQAGKMAKLRNNTQQNKEIIKKNKGKCC